MAKKQVKPEAITELEKKYKIKLYPYDKDKHPRQCFVQDKNGNVTELNLDGCGIGSMEIIGDLVSLRRLSINNNTFSRIEHFGSLTGLEYLSLWFSVNIRKIEGLDSLVNLTGLWVGCNKISRIEGLDTLHKLEELHIRGLGIGKVENLGRLRNLKKLYITGGKITEISGLDTLENLEVLEFEDTKISGIKNLDALKRLRSLSVSGSISVMENLDSLTGLETLGLPSNAIGTIAGLEKLGSLKKLNLLGNEITRLENLDSQVNLEELILYSNKISEIGNIKSLSKLKKLDLRQNKLRDIPDLSHLESLEYLDLSQNQLTEKPDLAYLNLKSLDTSYNPIKAPPKNIPQGKAASNQFIISNMYNTNGYDKELDVDTFEALDNAGYTYSIEDNSVYQGNITEGLSFKVHYKEEETLYYLNDFDVAVQSGHCELGFLTWPELMAIAARGKDLMNAWFFILLPITAVEPGYIPDFRRELIGKLAGAGIQKKQINIIAACMEDGVSVPAGTFKRNGSGILDSQVNHSTRRIKAWKDEAGYMEMMRKLESLADKK